MNSAKRNDLDRSSSEEATGASGEVLRILSGGAANGLVSRLEEQFNAQCQLTIEGDFGAVGGMRDRVVSGEAVDVVILTRSLIEELADQGHVEADSVRDLGQVVTGIAVRSGARKPAVSTASELRDLLASASALYVPHTTRSTAGKHVAAVLKALGLDLSGRLREFSNGQSAMAAMAEDAIQGAVGCTQITEILNTEGVDYAGDLPGVHGLVTTYTAAISTAAAQPQAAAALISLLSDPSAQETREAAGFS